MRRRSERILASLPDEVCAEVLERITASPRRRLSVRQALATMGVSVPKPALTTCPTCGQAVAKDVRDV